MMASSTSLPAVSALEHLASLVAVTRERGFAGIVDRLIQRVLVLDESVAVGTADEVRQLILSRLSVAVDSREVSRSLERMGSRGEVLPNALGHLAVDPETASTNRKNIEESRQLEVAMREGLRAEYSLLGLQSEFNACWEALLATLTGAFSRHGMQVVLFLNPNAEGGAFGFESLAAIARAEVSQRIEGEIDPVTDLLVRFIESAARDRVRADYLSQLADGAVSYLIFNTSPAVADAFRQSLPPTLVFLDTNFVFGLLGLNESNQIEVSQELLAVATREKLPFKFRYHESTKREIDGAIQRYGDRLTARNWSQGLSRAICATGWVSSIELKYHSINGQTPLSPSDFLCKYENWQLILKQSGIDIFRDNCTQERLRDRSTLEAEYKDFLTLRSKEKFHDAIQHDMTVLEAAIHHGGKGIGSLDSGAFFLSCDYYLLGFDQASARQERRPPRVLLPTVLWQILRPFTSKNDDYDLVFAKSFSLPELAIAKGSAARASQHLVSILATFDGVSEQVASRVLTNKHILEQITDNSTDSEIAELIHSDIARQAQELQEELAATQNRLVVEEAARSTLEAENALRSEELARAEQEARTQGISRREAEEASRKEADRAALAETTSQTEAKRAAAAEAESERFKMQVKKLECDLLEKEEGRKEAARLAREELESKSASQLKVQYKFRAAMICLSLVPALVVGIPSILHIDLLAWIPNSDGVGVRTCVSGLVSCIVLAIFVREWRKWLLGTAGVGISLTLASLLQ